MFRTFGVKTLTGTAQPVFGDVLQAAIILEQHDVDTTITVTSTAYYQQGDRIVVDPLLVNQNTYKITNILSGTQMQCSLESAGGHTHAAGALIQLADACGNAILQSLPGNAGPVVLGADNTVTAALGGSVLFVVEPVAAGTQPNTWQLNPNGGYNTCNTGEAWMVGTAGDKVLAYAWVF